MLLFLCSCCLASVLRSSVAAFNLLPLIANQYSLPPSVPMCICRKEMFVSVVNDRVSVRCAHFVCFCSVSAFGVTKVARPCAAQMSGGTPKI
jgi:hypothetical protein